MKSRTRIVLQVQEFPKTSETFIASKFVGLNQIGKDVHLLCNRSYPEQWSKFPVLLGNQELLRRVHVCWPHRPRWIAALMFPLVLIRCLLRRPATTVRYFLRGFQTIGIDVFRRFYLDSELVLLKPDLIHFEFGALATGRMYVGRLLDCKIAVSFRGYDLNYVGLENPDHYSDVWERADVVHFLGEDLWRRAGRRGCPEYKAKVLIPPAIDTTQFQCERKPAGVSETSKRPFRILSVGSLEWKKGYEYALQAVKLLMETGIECEYRIIGDGEGDYLEALMYARQELGLNDVVDLLGALPQNEVRDQMHWADVLLHSAVSEGFCNTVLEAQAMCLPVVCTDAGGLKENILHASTGFVVSRRRPQMMANQLALLAHQPHLRDEMGSRGRTRVQSEFSVESQIERFADMYDQLLSAEQVAGEQLPQKLLATGQVE